MPNAKSNEVQIGGFSPVFLAKSQMLKARKLLEGKENTHLWKGACGGGGGHQEGRGQTRRTLFPGSWWLSNFSGRTGRSFPESWKNYFPLFFFVSKGGR